MNILVTGATGDIGSAICDDLRSDFDVLGISSRDLDFSNRRSVDQWLASNANHKFHGVVLTAGVNTPISLDSFNETAFMETFNINFLNQMYLVMQLVPHMVQAEFGRIVAISSLYGTKSRNGRFNYSVSKAALERFVEYLALEYGQFGILSNSILPGFIDTKLTQKNNSVEKIKELQSQIPLGRLGTPGDIAYAVRFLISKSNKYINGHSLIVDGGYSL